MVKTEVNPFVDTREHYQPDEYLTTQNYKWYQENMLEPCIKGRKQSLQSIGHLTSRLWKKRKSPNLSKTISELDLYNF